MDQVVKIFTNHVEGGWSPFDLDGMLGGSEECVVLLSEALRRKNYKVIVYHTQKLGDNDACLKNGVTYKAREKANCFSDDIFITFKDATPWKHGARAKVRIHWSSDVERQWDTELIDWFVNLTPYHQSRNIFVPSYKSKIIPHGIDINSLIANNCNLEDIETDTLLYCSSPDRGLSQLLTDWEWIKTNNPKIKLKITYGFDLFDKIVGKNGDKFKKSIMKHIEKYDDIKFLGTLTRREMEMEYWKTQYWVLPLSNPDSELFCLNALKTKFCGAKPIVNKIGALKNTVGTYIPYLNFIDGNLKEIQENRNVRIMNWDQIVTKYWIPLFES
jgi:hypothetical protein